MKKDEAKEVVAIIEQLVAKGYCLNFSMNIADWTLAIYSQSNNPGRLGVWIDKDKFEPTKLAKTKIDTHVHGNSMAQCVLQLRKYLDVD